MGRPSKLTEAQWAEIGEKLLTGISIRDLAAEYGVGKSAISERFTGRNRTIRTAAEKLVAVETQIRALTIPEQHAVRGHAARLMAISNHMASAVEYGAATSHRLAALAHSKVQEVDDSRPLDDESREALKDVAVLTKMANDAGAMAMTMLSAHKDRTQRVLDEAEVVEADVKEIIGMDVRDAAKAYQDFIQN